VDCFGVRLAISLSVSPSATQRDESTSARGLRAAARFPRPQRPWVFFVPLARQRCRRSLLVALQNPPRGSGHAGALLGAGLLSCGWRLVLLSCGNPVLSFSSKSSLATGKVAGCRLRLAATRG